MKPQIFLPLVTYTDPNSETVAANAVAIAALLGAELNVLAVNVTIPPVSNALSRFLLDVPDMIRQAEATSRKHGERLTEAVEAAAKAAGVAMRAETIAESQPLLGATAALGVLGHRIAVTKDRGRPIRLEDGTHVLPTVHPSYLLRLPDEATRAAERLRFIDDLKTASRMLEAA